MASPTAPTLLPLVYLVLAALLDLALDPLCLLQLMHGVFCATLLRLVQLWECEPKESEAGSDGSILRRLSFATRYWGFFDRLLIVARRLEQPNQAI